MRKFLTATILTVLMTLSFGLKGGARGELIFQNLNFGGDAATFSQISEFSMGAAGIRLTYIDAYGDLIDFLMNGDLSGLFGEPEEPTKKTTKKRSKKKTTATKPRHENPHYSYDYKYSILKQKQASFISMVSAAGKSITYAGTKYPNATVAVSGFDAGLVLPNMWLMKMEFETVWEVYMRNYKTAGLASNVDHTLFAFPLMFYRHLPFDEITRLSIKFGVDPIMTLFGGNGLIWELGGDVNYALSEELVLEGSLSWTNGILNHGVLGSIDIFFGATFLFDL